MGRVRRYPDEIRSFIAENVWGRTTRDLVELVNAKFDIGFTVSTMTSYKKNHKLSSGTPKGLPAGRPTKLFPAEVRGYIQRHYRGTGHREMAQRLNRKFGTTYTVIQIKAYYGRNKLNSGLNGQFRKGDAPWNKGKKGLNIGGEQTQFKKGNRPHTWVPVGTEVIENKDGYTKVKMAEPDVWKYKHRLIWEKHHGPIPDGHAVIFGDGDRRNFDIDNLILVSRAQLAVLNKKGLIQSDADLTRTGIIIADICRGITRRKQKVGHAKNAQVVM